MVEGDEQELVAARLRDEGERALAVEFERHRERLRRMVEYRLGSRLGVRVDADDVLQEAFLNAAQRLSHYLKDPSKSLFVWLYMIVNQTLVDIHRRHVGAEMRDVNREIGFGSPGSSSSSSALFALHLADSLTSPSGVAVRAELQGQLEKAIASMDPLDQEVISLRHFEDLTNAEVAELLGIRPTAASNRYVRALARLKELLDQLGWPVDER